VVDVCRQRMVSLAPKDLQMTCGRYKGVEFTGH
jgi:hypothetical protein